MLNTGSPNAVPIRLALALTVFNFIGANAMRVLVTLYVLELGAAPWVVGVVGGLLYLFPLLLSWPIGAMADRRSASCSRCTRRPPSCRCSSWRPRSTAWRSRSTT